MNTARILGIAAILCGVLAGPVRAQPQAAGAATPDVGQRLDQVQSSLVDLSRKVEDNKGWTVKDVLTSIGGISALIAAVISLVGILVTRSVNMMALNQKANEEKAKYLQDKLDKFYGPLVQLRNKSTLLYKAFKARQPDSENFRTLTALLSGKTFDGNDGTLLDEIIKVGEETENLIMASSGLVDEDLQQVLGKATTHYTVLRMAKNQQLQGDHAQFEPYVFPRELDAAIAAKVKQIKDELTRLRAVN